MSLSEVFAAGMQSVQAKGTELLRKPVELSLKGVRQGGWDSASGLTEFTLVFPVAYSQDVSGNGVFLLDARYAALVAELMFENDPAELPKDLSELQMTAAAEAFSQMVSAMGEGLGRAAHRKVQVSAGDLKKLEGDGVAVARGQIKEDRVAIVDCTLKIGAHSPVRLVHLLPASLAETLAADAPAGAPGSGTPEITLGAPQSVGPGGAQRVQPVQFGTFSAPGEGDSSSVGTMDLLLDVPLEITVELGRATKRMRDVLNLGPGSILELSKLAGESVDLLVNGKPIAKGEVVVIDENFAIRIIEILSREERLAGGL